MTLKKNVHLQRLDGGTNRTCTAYKASKLSKEKKCTALKIVKRALTRLRFSALAKCNTYIRQCLYSYKKTGY
jgi:hypothetical protein